MIKVSIEKFSINFVVLSLWIFFLSFGRCISTQRYEYHTTWNYACATTDKKATINQLTTMLSTSKNVLFPGHNHLLTTSANEMTRHFDYCPSTSKVASMVVSWWIVAFLLCVPFEQPSVTHNATECKEWRVTEICRKLTSNGKQECSDI